MNLIYTAMSAKSLVTPSTPRKLKDKPSSSYADRDALSGVVYPGQNGECVVAFVEVDLFPAQLTTFQLSHLNQSATDGK